MWWNLKRRADRHGLEFNQPFLCLVDYQSTARGSLVAAHEAWGSEFTKLVCRWNFVEGRQIGVESNLEAGLRELGKDPKVVIGKAESGEIVAEIQR
jgi:2-hydroxychromene-2-carboxylate isomerase|tara:strand:- start:42 stop:329 length:288 start_codon:yes stop_codon:yes gene_type:complete